MMWIGIGIGIAVCFLFALTIQIAKNEGSKAAQLEALKAELKKQAEEQIHAQKIVDNVHAMSADDARRRLCELQSKQR